MNRLSMQRFVGILLVLFGVYRLANESVLIAIILIILGAAIFNGAGKGVWFDFICNNDCQPDHDKQDVTK